MMFMRKVNFVLMTRDAANRDFCSGQRFILRIHLPASCPVMCSRLSFLQTSRCLQVREAGTWLTFKYLSRETTGRCGYGGSLYIYRISFYT